MEKNASAMTKDLVCEVTSGVSADERLLLNHGDVGIGSALWHCLLS